MPPREAHLPAARALALLRIFTGAVFLVAASGKFVWYRVAGFLPFPVATADWQAELPARLSSWLLQHPTGIASAVVRDLLVPNGSLVAGSVAWLQGMAGLLLVLGLFTRTAAVAAVLVSGSLAVAAAANGASDARPYLLLTAIAVALLMGKAGCVVGLDGWRMERRRNREL
jgi:uncharacterized membrane protein YphA (DoxX/SURF4 family)